MTGTSMDAEARTIGDTIEQDQKATPPSPSKPSVPESMPSPVASNGTADEQAEQVLPPVTKNIATDAPLGKTTRARSRKMELKSGHPRDTEDANVPHTHATVQDNAGEPQKVAMAPSEDADEMEVQPDASDVRCPSCHAVSSSTSALSTMLTPTCT